MRSAGPVEYFLADQLNRSNIFCLINWAGRILPIRSPGPVEYFLSDQLNRSSIFCQINWPGRILPIRSLGPAEYFLSDQLNRSNIFYMINWPAEYSLSDHLNRSSTILFYSIFIYPKDGVATFIRTYKAPRSSTFWPINWTDIIFSVWSTGPAEYYLSNHLWTGRILFVRSTEPI